MLYMIDTGAAGAIVTDRSAASAAHLRTVSPSAVCVSALTRAELLHGLRRVPTGHRLHLVVDQFLKIVRTMPWDADAADWHARIRPELARVGELDTMIAAHSLALGAVLVAVDPARYAGIVAPLQIADWSKA
ncbi:PIN domain-containing protein (plasmid) [Ralstonia pseudosolanacearum]